MGSSALIRLIMIGTIVAMPVVGYAQQAAVSGTVTDDSGGVLPGVTVVAVHQESGNTFNSVTDERGIYRLAVRIGTYRLQAELQGFGTVTSSLELLVGQQAVVNLQMSLKGVAETVIVTGEAPLIDFSQSSLGGNIDKRQMQDLPVNGRNWMDLTILAPGSRANAVSDSPLPRDQGQFQLNIDGQQVTNTVCCGSNFGNPRYSRDAIAEFQYVSNRFDATQGRSAGVQMNVVTKSGTNTPSGSLSGYFRSDSMISPDFIQKRVLPYSDQQFSGTFGGPIVKDKIQYFASYEYEREPQTFSYTSPYPSFNFDQSGTRREHKTLARVDYQSSSQTHYTVRASKWVHHIPYATAGGAVIHPSAATSADRYSDQIVATITQPLGNRALNEIKGGYAGYHWHTDTVVTNGIIPREAGITAGYGTPRIALTGYSIGSPSNQPQSIGQDNYSIRDDFTFAFSKAGRHDMKLGGDYFYNLSWTDWCSYCNGALDVLGGPVPSNIQQLFPVWDDFSTWNLAALSPITTRYRQAVGSESFDNAQNVTGLWAQDDWMVTPRLTLNLGVRYDIDFGGQAETVTLLPFLTGDRPTDMNNVAPRLGFALKLNDRTVVRGGYGQYFTQLEGRAGQQATLMALILIPETVNDGRADFASNPYNGNPPTFDSATAKLCSTAEVAGCVRRDITSAIPDPNFNSPYSYQTSIGLQRQLGQTMAFEGNFVLTRSRHEQVTQNGNMSYNPATGTNYPFSDVTKRPFTDFGIVQWLRNEGSSDYKGLEMSFTKRLSSRWQASGTYTLSSLHDKDPLPLSGFEQVTFALAPDLGGESSLAATDQRHRAVFDGIWDVGHGFRLSGLYFYGSGYRFTTNYGGDLRNTGATGYARLRPDGTIVPRNNLVGLPVHRVDMRIQQRLRLGGRASVDGILEVFNLFNHANYGSYVTQESNKSYGQPTFNNNVAYTPRLLQLGLRFAF